MVVDLELPTLVIEHLKLCGGRSLRSIAGSNVRQKAIELVGLDFNGSRRTDENAGLLSVGSFVERQDQSAAK
jgi:hypothetical protein